MSFTLASSLVFTDLKSFEELTRLLSGGSDSVYPLIASDKETDQYVNYYIEEESATSKEANRFLVVVRSYSEHYEKCCEIADRVRDALGASNTFYQNLGGKPYVSEDGWFFIEQRFYIKI